MSRYSYTRYAITFGEILGNKKTNGFSVKELHQLSHYINHSVGQNIAKVTSISSALPEHLRTEHTDAAILVIRNGAAFITGHSVEDIACADNLFEEQCNKVDYDTKYFDARKKKTLHRRARHTIGFSDQDVYHSEDYRQCSVKSFSSIPHLSQFRNKLPYKLCSDKAIDLEAEGNLYYNSGCGIGFHGDSDRKIVICLSLGRSTTLRYQWLLPGSSEHPFDPVDINIRHGDVYIMSEKATGYDWRMRSRVRVVHAAGSDKYIGN